MRLATPPAALLRRLAACCLLGAAAVTAGCATASRSTTDAATAGLEIENARESVREARAVGAEGDAPAELRAATTRLSRAEDALAAGDAGQAARLAREAAVDAQLAEVTVLAARARTTRSLYDEVRALRARADSAMAN